MQECKKMEERSLWKTLSSFEIFCKAIDFRYKIGYNGVVKRVMRRNQPRRVFWIFQKECF